MFTPTTRNPGFVSRRGDDRRIAQVLLIEPGRWDVYWADGASVSVLAPTEDVARLRAQLRRDQSERAMGQAVTTFVPNPEVAAELYHQAHEAPTPPYARGPVDVGRLTPLPAPPGRYAAVASSGVRARALADAVAAELDEATDEAAEAPPLHTKPATEAHEPRDPGPAPTLPPRPTRSIPIQGGPPRRAPPTGGAWIAAVAVASTAALLVAGLAALGVLLALRGAA